MTEFPESIRRMVVTMTTLMWFGVPQERIAVDFGPTPDDACLHGIIAILGEDHLVVGGIPCGRVGVEFQEAQRHYCVALWIAACDTWNALAPDVRDSYWKAAHTPQMFIEMGTALGLIGALDEETVNAKLAELG